MSHPHEQTHEMDFLKTRVPKTLLLINMLLVVGYLYIVGFVLEVSNLYLFGILIVGQIFYTLLGLAHLYTLWNMDYQLPLPPRARLFKPSVDVFITVAGEPVDIVEETARAAKAMDYSNFQVYILNDGYVAKKDNWREIEEMAKRVGVYCITRTTPGGAKAGNINNALAQTSGELVVIFDADHVPHADFLQKTVPYFARKSVGFVQSPQYYKNYKENTVAGGAWDQQKLYYGAICKGKNRLHAVTMCGTNMVIRREPLEAVGGMCSTNIAEDFITGMFIHERGWKSVYVPEVLAEGLAPEDFLSYYKQQHRWARGSLEVFWHFNPLFRRGLTIPQRLQYLSSSSYYMTGVIVVLNSLMPIIFFFTGESIFTTSTMALAAAFLPYIFLTLYNLQRSSHFTYTFRALSFSMSSFPIHVKAFLETIFGMKQGFAITSKRKIEGTFIREVTPHILYITLAAVGLGMGFIREGMTPSFITNAAWALLNVAIFLPFIRCAMPSTSLARSRIADLALPPLGRRRASPHS